MSIRMWFVDVEVDADGSKGRVWFANEEDMNDFVSRTSKAGVRVTKGWEWREEVSRR